MVGKRYRRGRKERSEANASAAVSPAVRPGLEGGNYCPLSKQEVAAVHDSALALLESLGLSQATRSMIERVTSAGGTLADDGRLRFPRDLVESTIRDAKRGVTLHGRDAGLDITLRGRRVHKSLGRRSSGEGAQEPRFSGGDVHKSLGTRSCMGRDAQEPWKEVVQGEGYTRALERGCWGGGCTRAWKGGLQGETYTRAWEGGHAWGGVQEPGTRSCSGRGSQEPGNEVVQGEWHTRARERGCAGEAHKNLGMRLSQ